LPHKLRKVRKKRGSRTHGFGQVGQHRKGSKGERKAGRHKGGWTYVIAKEPDYFQKKGFNSMPVVKLKTSVINVGELDELSETLAERQKAKEGTRKTLLDLNTLGYHKLLGKGRVTKPLRVKIAAHSATAARKIEAAGGKILKDEN